jgi:hypothetical protein
MLGAEHRTQCNAAEIRAISDKLTLRFFGMGTMALDKKLSATVPCTNY